MEDVIVRAISKDRKIRGFAANTTALVQELQNRQQTTPVVTAALGRTATMGAILGCTLKEPKHQVSIQVVGDGPIGKISVDANGEGEVRGTVDQPHVNLPLNERGKLDVAKAVGNGTIYLLRDLGLKKPYQGTSPIISGELAEDFTYYFAASEQIPSSVGLGVLVRQQEILASGGYLIQVMPGAMEASIDQLESNVKSLSSITDILQEGTTPEQLLHRLMGDEIEILSSESVRFACRCSTARVEKMLIQLGENELRSILNEQGEAEVVCHYCHEKYHFNREALKEVLTKID